MSELLDAVSHLYADGPVLWFGLWPDGAGGVYWWTNTGAEGGPEVGHVPGGKLAPLLHDVESALPQRQPDETEEQAVRRAGAGALADPEPERRLAVELGRLLVPEPLRRRLLPAGPTADPALTVVVAAGPTLSRIPWELLAVDDGGELRLLEAAHVRGGLSPANIYRRARPPAPSDGAVLRVVDPSPPEHRALSEGDLDRWRQHRDARGGDLAGAISDDPVGRDVLAELLVRRPRRVFYLGHAMSGPPDRPAAASLLLADGPFTAAEWIREPDRWPLPPRLAIIACHSNDTHTPEQMGLVVAAVNAGAELVTGTRWTLPTDTYAPGGVDGAATTRLALAVDVAHDGEQPLAELRDWQLDQLARWRSGEPAAAPLLWAAPVSYLAPHLPELEEAAEPAAERAAPR